ncbi:unnamed protein product [Closterium sp. Naga37s-1]|nr:unnamed protein product [Closterium sp. Naga37s-1]
MDKQCSRRRFAHIRIFKSIRNVEILSRVHHRNLVRILGYHIGETEELIVFEFMANGSLDHHLHGNACTSPIGWERRLQMAIDAAKGLAYLHHDCYPKVVHRDIKASNILLDANMNAQVGDFGLARFFGVLLLELLTGRQPVDVTASTFQGQSLVEWAWQQTIGAETIKEILDPQLNNVYNADEALCMWRVALDCVNHIAKKRPTMDKVAKLLQDARKEEHMVHGTDSASVTGEVEWSHQLDMLKQANAAISPTTEWPRVEVQSGIVSENETVEWSSRLERLRKEAH